MRVTTKITWDMETWEVLEHDFFEYEGPIDLLCGPSSGLKALNSTMKTILSTSQNEASTIFGAASTVFNNLIGGLQRIVQGGPSQAGFSAAELNAKNALAVQTGATMARNLGGAAASTAAAIGGGNVVTPAGGTQASVLAAKTAAASETATAENAIEQQNYDVGRQNYWSAVGAEQQLPNVFNPAISAEGQVDKAGANAIQTQKEMDTQSNWWQPMVTAAIGGASSAFGAGAVKSLFSPSNTNPNDEDWDEEETSSNQSNNGMLPNPVASEGLPNPFSASTYNGPNI